MNVMTKRGSLDNVITYEHFCDAKSDLANIPKSQITLGSVAIVLNDEDNSLGVYIADSSKVWTSAMISAGGSSGSTSVDLISICTSEEYDSSTGLPTIENPEENKLYLVPNNGDNNNLFNEWIWTGEEWEQFGGDSVTITQSDWNQNDSTASDYIKNRICYTAGTTQQTIIDNDYTLSNPFNRNSKYVYGISLGAGVLFDENITASNEAGVSFIIDNQEYNLNYCIKYTPNPSNPNYFSYVISDTATQQETPTAYLNIDSSGYLMTFSYTSDTEINGNHHITIAKNSENNITIPTKYLPNWPYASISDIPQQLVAAGSGQNSRVLNGSNSSAASGNYSVSEGQSTTASGCCSHAEGKSTTANGIAAHAEGKSTTASAETAHAEGVNTTSSAIAAHAEGSYTTASGSFSHSEGYYTIAKNRSQHVFGECNIADASVNNSGTRGDYVEIVGNGASTAARSNARTLDWSGNEWLAGNLTAAGGSLTIGSTTITEQQLIALLSLASATGVNF